MRAIHFLLATLLGGAACLFALPVYAQSSCPAQGASANIVSGNSYTLSANDNCGFVVFTNSGAVTVNLPVPGLVFQPGRFTTTLLPTNGATLTLAPANGPAASPKINGLASLSLGAGQNTVIAALLDNNWYTAAGAPPSGTGSFMTTPAGNATAGAIQSLANAAGSATLSLGGAISIPTILNFTGVGSYGFTNSATGLHYSRTTSPGANDGTDLYITRNAAYTGGTPGFVNSVIAPTCSVGAGGTSYEWCESITMVNHGTAADGSENQALGTFSRKQGTGKTWTNTFQFWDESGANPTTSTVNTEMDLAANGTDNNNVRVFMDMIGTTLNPGVGADATVAYGLRVSADTHTTLGTDIAFGPSKATGTLVGTFNSPSFSHGIDLSGGTCQTDCFKSTGFLVSPSGALTETGLLTAQTTTAGGAATGVPSSLLAVSGTLGSTAGNDINIGGFRSDSGNSSYLNAHLRRVSTGSNFLTAAMGWSYDVDGSVNSGGSFWLYNGLFGIGGPTSSFPALNANAGAMEFKLADNSAYTSYTATTGKLNSLASDATHTDNTFCADSASGQLYKGSGTLGVCLGTSSLRFKHDVHDLTAGLSEIMRLEPIVYRPNEGYGDPNKDLYGFSAEQMRPVLPKLVGLDDKGLPNNADYLGVVPVLVKAIQQQQAEIVALRREMRRRR